MPVRASGWSGLHDAADHAALTRRRAACQSILKQVFTLGWGLSHSEGEITIGMNSMCGLFHKQILILPPNHQPTQTPIRVCFWGFKVVFLVFVPLFWTTQFPFIYRRNPPRFLDRSRHVPIDHQTINIPVR